MGSVDIEMNEENFYKLDKLIIDFWLKHAADISLLEISDHLSEKSLMCGNFNKNFEKIMQRKMSFGDECQVDNEIDEQEEMDGLREEERMRVGKKIREGIEEGIFLRGYAKWSK